MEEGRVYYKRKKSILILDKRFPMYADLNPGDIGQAIVEGVVDSERIEELPLTGDEPVKTIYINAIRPAIDLKTFKL